IWRRKIPADQKIHFIEVNNQNSRLMDMIYAVLNCSNKLDCHFMRKTFSITKRLWKKLAQRPCIRDKAKTVANMVVRAAILIKRVLWTDNVWIGKGGELLNFSKRNRCR